MDRITRIGIRNVRAIEQLTLDFARPLTVLIGENGAGKSTILECLEVLRRAADPSFFHQLYSVHRGLPGLLRKGATSMNLSIRVEDDLAACKVIEYSFTLRASGAGAVVEQETLLNGSDGFEVLSNHGAGATVWSGKGREMVVAAPTSLALAAFGQAAPDPRIDRMLRVLRGIEVHLPFDTRPSWGARSYQQPESIRGHTVFFPAGRLNLLGMNLANAWNELLAQPSQQRDYTLGLVQLGLGDRVDSVVVRPDMGGGNVYLGVRFKDLPEPVLAADLSDGQLSWLAFVAMARLNSERSLLAVDEPELHLHPSLLGRVVSMLACLPEGAPVVVSTHSDRVLEMLDSPAEAVRVCALEDGKAGVRLLDPEALPSWLEHFGDIRQLQAAGYLSRVLKAPAS